MSESFKQRSFFGDVCELMGYLFHVVGIVTFSALFHAVPIRGAGSTAQFAVVEALFSFDGIRFLSESCCRDERCF